MTNGRSGGTTINAATVKRIIKKKSKSTKNPLFSSTSQFLKLRTRNNNERTLAVRGNKVFYSSSTRASNV